MLLRSSCQPRHHCLPLEYLAAALHWLDLHPLDCGAGPTGAFRSHFRRSSCGVRAGGGGGVVDPQHLRAHGCTVCTLGPCTLEAAGAVLAQGSDAEPSAVPYKELMQPFFLLCGLRFGVTRLGASRPHGLASAECSRPGVRPAATGQGEKLSPAHICASGTNFYPMIPICMDGKDTADIGAVIAHDAQMCDSGGERAGGGLTWPLGQPALRDLRAQRRHGTPPRGLNKQPMPPREAPRATQPVTCRTARPARPSGVQFELPLSSGHRRRTHPKSQIRSPPEQIYCAGFEMCTESFCLLS